MPRRARQRRPRPARSLQDKELRMVTLAGRSIIYPNPSSGSSGFFFTAVNLAPYNLNSNRLQSTSDTFMAYRFTRLILHLHPMTLSSPTNTFGSNIVVSYTPVTSQSPSTFDDLVETPCSLVKSSGIETIPTSLPVHRSYLQGFLSKWLRTRASSAPDDFELQGSIFVGVLSTSSTNEVPIVVEWEVQFKDPVSTLLTFPAKPRVFEEYCPDADDSKSLVNVSGAGTGEQRPSSVSTKVAAKSGAQAPRRWGDYG